MPLLTYQDKTVYYAHCPKAGGTSVEEFMSQYGDLVFYDRRWFDKRQDPHNSEEDTPSSPQHMSWDDFQQRSDIEPDLIFAVVRDPLARILSEYKFQKRFRPALKWVYRLGFSIWLRAMLQAQKQLPHLADNHIRPQAQFMPDHAEIFRLEEGMDHVETFLQDALGVLDGAAGIGHAQVASSTQKQTKKIVPTAEDIYHITTFYAADYTRFGYEKPDVTQRQADPFSWAKNLIAWCLVPYIIRQTRLKKI